MKSIPFIRVNHLNEDKKIITNIFWENLILSNEHFYDYINEKIGEKSVLYEKIVKKWFLKKENYEKNAVEEYKKRFWINFIWPTLHIIVITKWCNHQCKYCHASADYRYSDSKLMLTEEDARKIVDIILESPSNNLTIEFQWWEPATNWDILKYIISYTEEKNKKLKKSISFAIVSNLTLLDEEKINYIIDNGNINLSTSLDWDKKVHDFNRLIIWNKNSNSSFDTFTEKLNFLRKKEKEKWKKVLYWAMWVVTKKTLPRYKELVDTYISLWFNSIFLKKLNWFWYSKNQKTVLWYNIEEFIEFYENYLSYLEEIYINKKIFVRDWYISLLLWKILDPDKTNFMDLRTPCWAWIWQIAYDYDWSIYTCDEWRMQEEDIFKIWDTSNSLKELIQNEVVWAMMDASTVESLPCDICAYAPYCWVCPIESYSQRWNIYTNQTFDSHCKFFTYLFDKIFESLDSKNKFYLYLKEYLNNNKDDNNSDKSL